MSYKSSESINKNPTPTDFAEFLPWASRNYSLDMEIVIFKNILKEYVSATTVMSKKRKASKVPKVSPVQDQELESPGDDESLKSEREAPKVAEKVVKIETVYDASENLVQLKFLKNKTIPRKLMQIIALAAPFQNYLTSITINSGLNIDCVYEISKFLPNSQVTELCFDGTYLSKANYHILLTNSKLKHLSLARCSINDDIVKMIAEQMRDPKPAARVLSALNLSANGITDIGAKYLANVLRSNRQLGYLNLAGNMITDEGGVSILNMLQKFTIQPHEVLEGRARYVAYLKKKNGLISALVKEMQTAAFDKYSGKRRSLKKSLTKQQFEIGADTQILLERAQYMAEKMLGFFDDPFAPNNTESKDGVVYCLGNNTLCCLNLAYNNLTYASLKKLRDVLVSQQFFDRTPRGLIKVVIEGNLMPIACEEYKEIEDLLGAGIVYSKCKKQSLTVAKKGLSKTFSK